MSLTHQSYESEKWPQNKKMELAQTDKIPKWPRVFYAKFLDFSSMCMPRNGDSFRVRRRLIPIIKWGLGTVYVAP